MISWHIAADGQYSASSAYAAQFVRRIKLPGLAAVWKVRAEGKVKNFLWLPLQNRNWTAERLRARGLPHNDLCSLCDQEFVTTSHLALTCPFAKEVWAFFQATNPRAVHTAAASNSINDWWELARHGKADEQRKNDITLAIYTIWHIWKERPADFPG